MSLTPRRRSTFAVTSLDQFRFEMLLSQSEDLAGQRQVRRLANYRVSDEQPYGQLDQRLLCRIRRPNPIEWIPASPDKELTSCSDTNA